jgi:phospholipid/cholesterol/gamma-HCH transport system permease protein
MGGSVVLMSLGFPLITFLNQVQTAVTYGSPVGGLVKAFFFGILVAAIGCLRGLQTKTGASAVGVSTTSAVVSGIILIVITDGVFFRHLLLPLGVSANSCGRRKRLSTSKTSPRPTMAK